MCLCCQLPRVVVQVGGMGEGHLQNLRFSDEQTHRMQKEHFIGCEPAFEVSFFQFFLSKYVISGQMDDLLQCSLWDGEQ